MPQATIGSMVRAHYTGKLSDGTVFDTSDGGEPLEFVIGRGDLIPGFEQGVIGMEAGQSKTVTIPAEQAYGAHDPERVIQVARNELPDSIPLELGLVLQGRQPGGQSAEFTVVEFDDASVILDGNHPLAGEDLIFEIVVVSVG